MYNTESISALYAHLFLHSIAFIHIYCCCRSANHLRMHLTSVWQQTCVLNALDSKCHSLAVHGNRIAHTERKHMYTRQQQTIITQTFVSMFQANFHRLNKREQCESMYKKKSWNRQDRCCGERVPTSTFGAVWRKNRDAKRSESNA